MKTEQIDTYRTRLENQLAELRKSAHSHQRQLDENHTTTNDFIGGDRAAELETLEVDVSIAESEENLARKIEHALKRIEDGTYGVCEGCGEPIPDARLDAKPSVSLCVGCQEKHETT